MRPEAVPQDRGLFELLAGHGIGQFRLETLLKDGVHRPPGYLADMVFAAVHVAEQWGQVLREMIIAGGTAQAGVLAEFLARQAAAGTGRPLARPPAPRLHLRAEQQLDHDFGGHLSRGIVRGIARRFVRRRGLLAPGAAGADKQFAHRAINRLLDGGFGIGLVAEFAFHGNAFAFLRRLQNLASARNRVLGFRVQAENAS